MPRHNIRQVEMIRTELDHPECINFGPGGHLYAGGFAGQVYVMNPPKFELRQLANTQGFVGGIAVDRNHNVYACNATKHSVMRVTQKGEVSVYCDRAPDGLLIMPNYGSFDAKGNYYFSDSGDY
jgi:sugar lactone lactonase YvrE